MKAALLVFVVDSLIKVFPSTLPGKNTSDELRLFCARNEYECGQIALRAKKEARVRVSLSPIEGPRGFILPPKKQLLGFVRYIPLKHNTPAKD